MIEEQSIQLRSLLMKKYNVQHPRDCRILAEKISKVTERNISETTLRRFLGLLPTKSIPSKYTLETLTIFLDRLSSRSEFPSIISRNRNKIEKESKRLIDASDGLNQSLIESLTSSNLVTNDAKEYISFFLKTAIKKGNIGFIKQLYDNVPYLMDNDFLFIKLGKLLKTQNVSQTQLTNLSESKNARLYFFERYVDTCNFKIYQKSLISYLRNEDDPIKILWANTILSWGAYLSEKQVDWKLLKPNQVIEKYHEVECHPFIRARILGVFMFCDTIDSKKVLELIAWEIENEYSELHLDQDSPPFFCTMIVHYLIFGNKTELLKNLLSVYAKYRPDKSVGVSQGVPFEIKLIKNILGIENYRFAFEDVVSFQSGFTNENYVVQTAACQFLSESSNKVEVDKLKSKIISQSGFKRLKDFCS